MLREYFSSFAPVVWDHYLLFLANDFEIRWLWNDLFSVFIMGAELAMISGEMTHRDQGLPPKRSTSEEL
jgi:hypothetical protein